MKIPSYKNIKMHSVKGINFEMTDVRRYEDYVLKFLSYRLNYYTSYTILEFLLNNGIVFNYEFRPDDNFTYIRDKVLKAYKFAIQLLICYSEENAFTNFNNIYLAFSCVVVAKELVGFTHTMNIELEKIYNIKVGNFIKCYQYLQT